MTRPGRLLLQSAVAAACLACGGPIPTDADGVTAGVLRRSRSIEIFAPNTLLVHEQALVSVVVSDANGHAISRPEAVVWDSSDPTVVTLSPDGVVLARERGTVTIGARVGPLRAETSITVKARTAIVPTYFRAAHPMEAYPERLTWALGVGDTLRFTAMYVDVDGAPVGEAASAVWASSPPGVVSVGVEGEAVGLRSGVGVLTVSTPDGTAEAPFEVWDGSAERPATLRLAHAAIGVGPVTFVHNRGAPVTLSFGESVDVPIASGYFFLDTEGLPRGDSRYAPSYASSQSFSGTVRAGERLAVYAVGGRCCGSAAEPFGSLVGRYDMVDPAISADAVRVRLIQGWTSVSVVYVVPPDAPPTGLPVECYFDPGDSWGYVERPAGDLDFVLTGKGGAQYGSVRWRASPEAGRSVTYVITEGDDQGLGIVAFPDP